MTFVWILLALLVLGGVFAVSQYNGLVALKNKVEEAWRQIDVELKRRHDLIPNLVETVKGYANHEQDTLEQVMRARSAAMAGGQTPAQAAQREGELSQALGRLISVTEAYPQLQANGNFQALMGELTSTEDRIASARRYYNAIVRENNTRIEAFPGRFFAGMAGARRAEYFETSEVEAQVPRVDFGQGGGAGRGESAPPVAGRSTQPGGQVGAPVPTRDPNADPIVTSGHGDAGAVEAPGSVSGLPQAQAPYDPQNPGVPNPNVDRTGPD